MGKESILGKIRRTVAVGHMSEAVAMYLLVEIRKYYEHDEARGAPFETLRLCCSWVAHIKLSRQEAKVMLTRVHEFVEATKRQPSERGDQSYFQRMIRLDTLRRELGEFFETHEIPAFDDYRWNEFLTHFLRVVEDCPLKLKVRDADGLCVDEGAIVAVDWPDRGHDEAPPVVFIFRKEGELQLQTSANSWRRHQIDDALEELGWQV